MLGCTTQSLSNSSSSHFVTPIFTGHSASVACFFHGPGRLFRNLGTVSMLVADQDGRGAMPGSSGSNSDNEAIV